MTIKLIDDALNIAITGLIYGSEIWLACAFILYVMRSKERKIRKAGLLISQPGIAITIHPAKATPEIPIDETLTETSPVERSLERLPLSVGESVFETRSVLDAEFVLDAKPVVEGIAKKGKAIASRAAEKTSAVKTLVVSQKPSSKKIVSQNSLPQKAASQQIVRPEIVCEPVDWKRWKVGDLRKASIYKACDVRIRPIGSRRNLPKGDLIAQYEQNLKRLTKQPPTLAVMQDQTA